MTRNHQGGIALLEAMLAIVILAIGLLGTIGLQARAYSALSDASMRAEATLASEKLLGVMMSTDQDYLSAYALAQGGQPDARLKPWYDETRRNIPGATITVSVAPLAGTTRSAVNIVISWIRKAGAAPDVHRVTSYISRSS